MTINIPGFTDPCRLILKVSNGRVITVSLVVLHGVNSGVERTLETACLPPGNSSWNSAGDLLSVGLSNQGRGEG